MLSKIISFSIRNKLIILLFTSFIIGYGLYSLSQLSIGAVPDITNNQVQVITTSQNLSTQDMEQFITYPVELEMANLPGVEEIRSVSKFGLSVVTIVFDEDMGTYLPRQLLAEKIQTAAANIPESFGKPEMGPITTGLGEIYQYILDTKPGYEDRYTAMELRTIQDWIVKRQLSGIPGVVEVNSWGGKLKQYEVAIDSEKLMAMNITASEVYTALEKNNSIAGGGYIERLNQAYFIRGEGLIHSLEDIENIVVKNPDGNPIYIRDIADVGFGSATRFGAITGNGEGEKVLGQVMMIKDGNSKQVIEAVKDRVEEVSENLPEGVYINAFLDRSELIAKTTWTITENLIFGFLIVIFVVVVLLGNLRSGLVVASVIPLSLLFAFSLMYLFGVDANLMSLGAIDFGIIIDGAVIIVEFIAYQMTSKGSELKNLSRSELSKAKDKITFTGASKMMNSAVFGQLIILIVFIPILSLSGVEGKMFRPMALTFSFALVGAMILCFTYVPVISSMVLKPDKLSDKNISVRLMRFITKLYTPTITWALKAKKLVLGIAVFILAITIYIFTTMGGEFVPTLDEGDFVIQPIFKTGTSLSETIALTTKMEQILMEFPEVKQAVSRIGAAEVPTDPMSMEESDVIITLVPKKDWVTADTKDGLAEKFKEALMIIPGMEVEFTQPIEMRFNELITGVRADIAIKIFGEDLDILNRKAHQIESLISDVEGAADITVEKIAGLPQMSVKYDRAKIARYGLNISDINELVSAGFAGMKMGSVFEGEKRFDLVVRLNEENRKDISNLENLYVDTPAGNKIPLNELAEISYQKGAAKISRDETQRRIVVGINVRNRDLQSVVDDVEALVSANIDLPPGYNITYGGQFENLQSAKNRLKIAVPVALVLIFFLLYFAFESVRDALIIYSAIPLSAVGGVFLLWIRDMPFSISAGVGFIALFGIAVLNGIVLIEHYKELKKDGMEHTDLLMKKGAKDRLRAVLLTASAAALGFLPMAISTGAGAEVQRPLATVVVGGLVTATLLTLVVLPVLYSLFGGRKTAKKNVHFKKSKYKLPVLILLFSLPGFSQEKELSFEEVRQLAIENNAGLQVSNLNISEAEAMVNSAFSFDKTEVYYGYNQLDEGPTDEPFRVMGIQQNFSFPTVYFSAQKFNKANVSVQEDAYGLVNLRLEKEVASAFYQLKYEQEKREIYKVLDSLYSRFAQAATRRFELGATNYLEKITAQARQRELQTQYQQAGEQVKAAYEMLWSRVQAEEEFSIEKDSLGKLEMTRLGVENHELLNFYDSREKYFTAHNRLMKQQLLPDFSINYFEATTPDIDYSLYGYQVGIKIPLLFSGQASKIKASKIAMERAEQETRNNRILLQTKFNQLQAELRKYQEALSYYENEGKELSREILKTANGSYENGEIDFFQYIQSLENAYGIQLSYLESLNAYNQTIISLNYLNL
ncbi:CusA/CzcA family heavy metal efflux RND transporter [Salegentibacter sediminis]|uniref:CusA/CzcA family heavy metal efflux RND transporter n=1 Tax=Salegentibacter sediminis TaxID=1930251 RepID=UPI0009C0B2A6|nr:CusA/CzcA family heavy metal efflux RND transporter [Salegentibacter sediminis]